MAEKTLHEWGIEIAKSDGAARALVMEELVRQIQAEARRAGIKHAIRMAEGCVVDEFVGDDWKAQPDAAAEAMKQVILGALGALAEKEAT
jgi:BioD-like phosphotransacetylase family protein